MTIVAGTRLGAYEIIGPLGVGGMGEVYLARDTRLDRDVAIKVLPEALAADPERIARFEREAKTLAALNHPNIAQIHGVEESGSVRALVMEFVDGDTLADRIARGSIPLNDALLIARQIADALDAAHEHGIVHRDLKPANVKVRPDGTVKVLDFGLAKALEPISGVQRNLGDSPTITSPAMTQMGVLLGTAAYMAPEQARGRVVDKRADVWAFGTVLFEMVSGRPPFPGDDLSQVLARVIDREPDWQALPAAMPAALRRLLTRCLRKDPKERLRDIGDARVQLEDLISGTESEPPTDATPSRLSWRRVSEIVLAICVGALITGGVVWKMKSSTATAAPVTRWLLPLGEGQQFTNSARKVLAVSPDGTAIVYVANRRLYLRSMADLDARPIPGTDDSDGVTSPAFSPDGRLLVFYSASSGALKTIAVTGGAVVTLCQSDNPLGVSWDQDVIFFGQGPKGIWRVTAAGGTPAVVARVTDTELASSPQVLPGGHDLLFAVAAGTAFDRWEHARIVVQSLTSNERRTLVEGGSSPQYVSTGHLVYTLGGSLLAVPFDVTHLAVTGRPTAVMAGVRQTGTLTGIGQFSVALTGLLAYIPGPVGNSMQMTLAWMDRQGQVAPLPLSVGPYEHPRIAPDSRRIAYDTDNGKDVNVWVYAPNETQAPRQLTFTGRNRVPVWSTDSLRVAFQSDREGDTAIYWQRVDGTAAAERLTTPDAGTTHTPESWSPDGKTLLFSVTNGSDVSLWALSLPDRHVAPFGAVHSQGVPPGAAFSPDGHWVAYTSTTSNEANFRLFVQSFPAGVVYQIGSSGVHPLWSPNGQELFFRTGPTDLARVLVSTRPTFTFSPPAPVPIAATVAGPLDQRNYDMSADSARFLTVVSASPNGSAVNSAVPQIEVIEHWFEELRTRVPAK
jgi:serine/threonine-protein kinase